MPAYNTEGFAGEALRSLFAQEYRNFEIVFIDDGSTDATPRVARELLEEWGGKFRFISQRNQGPGKARNSGMAFAEGDYLFFLDSDDLVEPALFSSVKKIIEDRPDLVLTGWERIDEDGSILPGQGGGVPCSKFPSDYAECLIMHLEGKFPFWTGGFFARRAFVEEQGLSFPEDLVPLEDILFMSECLLCAGSVKTIPDALSICRKRLSSITHGKDIVSQIIRANIGYSLRITSFIHKRIPEKSALAEFINKRMGVFFLLLLREYLRTGKEDFFRAALKERAIRRVIRGIILNERHEFEDRVKAGILICMPCLFKLRYRIKYKEKIAEEG